MEYEFYADAFFLTNCCLDFLAFYMIAEILSLKKRIRRFLTGAAISSLLGCLLFLMAADYNVYLIGIHFIINPAVTLFCYFPVNRIIYLKSYLLIYFSLLMLGGFMQWFYGTVTGGRYFEVCLLLSAVPVMIFCYIIRQKRKKVQVRYPVLLMQNDRKIALTGFFDTGNRLTDPYSGNGVHVVSENMIENLGLEKFRLVPFSSVGNTNGLMKAYTIDEMQIMKEQEKQIIKGAVLAAGDTRLFENKEYQIILHNSVFDEK